MPDDQHDPNPPPSKNEMDRVDLEFYRLHYKFLENLGKRSPRTVHHAELAQSVSLLFHNAYVEDVAFRAAIKANGMRSLRGHPLFWTWVRKRLASQWKRHYGAMPRQTTLGQILWLRLAACRDDGMLFPLVRDRIPVAERRILKALEAKKMRKVWTVPTQEGDGVWVVDADLGSMTLRPTEKDFGGGDQDLEILVKHGYFERLPCADPNLRWKYDDNMPVTLQLTAMGRDYIDGWASGAHLVSTHRDDDGGEDDLVDDVAGAEERYDEASFKSRSEGIDLKAVLDIAIDVYQMPTRHARAYLLLKVGDPPDEGPWILERVAKEVGVASPETPRRWKERYDELFEDPGVLAGLKKHMDRN